MVEGTHLVLNPVLLVYKGSPQQGFSLLVRLFWGIALLHRHCLKMEEKHFKLSKGGITLSSLTSSLAAVVANQLKLFKTAGSCALCGELSLSIGTGLWQRGRPEQMFKGKAKVAQGVSARAEEAKKLFLVYFSWEAGSHQRKENICSENLNYDTYLSSISIFLNSLSGARQELAVENPPFPLSWAK